MTPNDLRPTAKMVLMGLDSLLTRKRIPKKRRYAKGSRTKTKEQ